VHAREIVAIAGVAGNGQAALADLLCGVLPLGSGQVRVNGKALAGSPFDCLKQDIGRIPEDRSHIGVVGDMTLWENAIIEDLHDTRFARIGVVRRDPARQHARALVQQFDVRTQGVDVPIRSLSGGNIQKLILGRVLSRKPQLIVANQPTWGLDVGAVAAIREHLVAACAAGAGVLLISEDLEEIMALADRIAVMSRGQLSEARLKSEWTLASLGLAMTAMTPEKAPLHAA
jgi:general nucleoside transport system ATP-binding protein